MRIFGKLAVFLISFDIYIPYSASGVREPPLRFDSNLLRKFHWLCNRFQLFKITRFSNSLIRLAASKMRNLLYSPIIGNCVVCRCNLMFFLISLLRNLRFFDKLSVFVQFLTFVVIVQVFAASGVRQPPLGFDSKIHIGQGIFFQLFNITCFGRFLKKKSLLIFSSFFENFCHFSVSGVRKPPLWFDKNLLKFFIGHVSVFNFLILHILAFFFYKPCNFFQIF